MRLHLLLLRQSPNLRSSIRAEEAIHIVEVGSVRRRGLCCERVRRFRIRLLVEQVVIAIFIVRLTPDKHVY